MNIRTSAAVAALALLALVGARQPLNAQVVEGRDAEANPASVMFRSTLYGAGTGLALGGAYALIEEGGDPSTGEILRWGTAIGAAAGLAVGLVYVATRSQPEGEVNEIGMLQLEDGGLSFSPRFVSTRRVERAEGPDRVLDVHLVRWAAQPRGR